MADSGKEGKEDQGPDLSWLPEGTEPLADGDYDAIVMGTGLKVRKARLGITHFIAIAIVVLIASCHL